MFIDTSVLSLWFYFYLRLTVSVRCMSSLSIEVSNPFPFSRSPLETVPFTILGSFSIDITSFPFSDSLSKGIGVGPGFVTSPRFGLGGLVPGFVTSPRSGLGGLVSGFVTSPRSGLGGWVPGFELSGASRLLRITSPLGISLFALSPDIVDGGGGKHDNLNSLLSAKMVDAFLGIRTIDINHHGLKYPTAYTANRTKLIQNTILQSPSVFISIPLTNLDVLRRYGKNQIEPTFNFSEI